MTIAHDGWPKLPYGGAWYDTREYLHLVSQMLGKLRVALAPPLPQWFHTPLALRPHGLTTRLIPSLSGSIEAEIDVIDHIVRIEASGGRTREIPLLPARPIADLWRDFQRSLAQLGISTQLFEKPQERTDATLFSLDGGPRQYDPVFATAWFALLTEVYDIFEEWRSPFFGRSGVNFWWGGFDLTTTLFSGRRSTPPQGSNYIQRYDLDAEHLTVGFWPGDSDRRAMFFGYVVPEPPGCPDYDLGLPSASWAPAMAEWILPYDDVRRADDRRTLVRTFADRIFAAARDLGGWPMEEFTYVQPPRRETSS